METAERIASWVVVVASVGVWLTFTLLTREVELSLILGGMIGGFLAFTAAAVQWAKRKVSWRLAGAFGSGGILIMLLGAVKLAAIPEAFETGAVMLIILLVTIGFATAYREGHEAS